MIVENQKTVRTIVCFHKPDEENGYLSNWFRSSFKTNGVVFSSVEQYMMYSKAIVFKDTEIARQILSTADVALIKALGRSVKNYNDNKWSGIRQIVVYEGLYEKFSQNEKLKKLLLSTGDAILAECAVRDMIWGIGLSMRDPDRLDQRKWRGQNLLGYALMMVREKISLENK